MGLCLTSAEEKGKWLLVVGSAEAEQKDEEVAEGAGETDRRSTAASAASLPRGDHLHGCASRSGTGCPGTT